MIFKNILDFFNQKSIRSRNFLINTSYNIFFVGAKLGISLLLIPLILETIDRERFGIWQTILSFVAFMGVLKFGNHHNLRNLITKLIAQSFTTELNKLIGATYIKLIKISVIILILLIPLIYFFFIPETFFLDSKISSNETLYSVLIFVSFTLLNNVLSLTDSIAYGYQKSSLTNLFQLIYFLLSYLSILFLRIYYQLNLIDISIIFGVIQTFTYVLFIIYQRIKFNLRIKFNSNYSLKDTRKTSFSFFMAHLLSLIFLSMDNFIISSMIGAEETASYSIVNKLFFALITVFSILLIHFWNSVTDAYEKKEFKWISKILNALYLIAFFIFLGGLIISFLQREIINFWLGDEAIIFNYITFYLFSVYTFFHCINAIFVYLQNGLGTLKIQIYTSIVIIISYVLACFIVDINKYGYDSIIIIKIVAMGLSMVSNSFILKKVKAHYLLNLFTSRLQSNKD
jgi:O-antigen/teichoic acid export membrane protein